MDDRPPRAPRRPRRRARTGWRVRRSPRDRSARGPTRRRAARAPCRRASPAWRPPCCPRRPSTRSCSPGRTRPPRLGSAARRSAAIEPQRPKVPGVRNRSLLSKIARPRIVPECALISLSTKFITPLMRPVVFVGELHPAPGSACRATNPAAPRTLKRRIADVVGFRAVEHEIDRIQPHDGGQQGRAGLAAGDQVAGIDPAGRRRGR